MVSATTTARAFHHFPHTVLMILVVLSTLSIPAHAQNFQWVRQFGSNPEQARDDQANAVATTFGSVYVAGNTIGVFAGQTSAGLNDLDVFVARYDNLGSQIWLRQFGTAARDIATGVAADASGVYVAGWTEGTLPQQTSSGSFDAFVRKYSPNGTELWTRQFGSTALDEALAIAVNASGVYVVGFVDCCAAALPGFPTTGGKDAFIRKYDANGNELWTRQFGSGDAEQAVGVALDATGVYVAGTTNGNLAQPAAGNDGFLRKFDVNGNVVWTRQFGSSPPPGGNNTDDVHAVAVGAAGVFVSGDTTGPFTGQTFSGGLWDAFVIKFDSNGTQQFVRQFGTDADDYAYAVAVGTSNVLVGGDTGGAFPGQTYTSNGDAYVRLYDFNGNHLGTREFGSSGGSIDTVFGAAEDLSGFYVAGQKGGDALGTTPLGGEDAFVLKVLPAPVTFDTSVVSTATFVPAPAPVAPGSIATVFGVYVNDGSLVPFTFFDQNSRLTTRLGDASVTLNGIPAPMLFSFPGQLAIQIPYELEGQTTATLRVTVGGQTGAPSTVRLDSVVPGVFTFNQSGTGAAAVLHQDGVTPVTAANPARPGEIVTLYATGLGAVNPPLPTGAPSVGNLTVAATTVSVGGVASPQIDYSGVSPGFVGLYQVNFRIPPNAPTGSTQPLVLNVGGKNANPVTIAVGP
jgi:uncharacterized protein (TIGR03437 family)